MTSQILPALDRMDVVRALRMVDRCSHIHQTYWRITFRPQPRVRNLSELFRSEDNSINLSNFVNFRLYLLIIDINKNVD